MPGHGDHSAARVCRRRLRPRLDRAGGRRGRRLGNARWYACEPPLRSAPGSGPSPSGPVPKTCRGRPPSLHVCPHQLGPEPQDGPERLRAFSPHLQARLSPDWTARVSASRQARRLHSRPCRSPSSCSTSIRCCASATSRSAGRRLHWPRPSSWRCVWRPAWPGAPRCAPTTSCSWSWGSSPGR